SRSSSISPPQILLGTYVQNYRKTGRAVARAKPARESGLWRVSHNPVGANRSYWNKPSSIEIAVALYQGSLPSQ
ncbi:MAG TPA: hypothetical protein VK513_10645, partial [Terriglobales bacterium]|nr:hypothetical protein [Terriglobales bacterium]